MNKMKEYIEACVLEMQGDYRNIKRIRQDYKRERELNEAYQGRELLELIQNADDELVDGLCKEVKIEFDGITLSISNYGNPFTCEGVDSLMYSNLSPKAQKNMVIGNKGTGFRAILGWAEEITIHSGDLHIHFSDSYAQEKLNELLKDEVQKKGLKAATLVFPEWINEESDSPYTTEISIKIKQNEEVVDDIRKQITAITGDLLLFLNRTESIRVVLDGKSVCYRRVALKGNQVNVEKYIDDSLDSSQTWILKRKDGKFEDKNYSVVIAYKKDGSLPDHQVIYSYFPTDVDFPFPVLLHANFNLKPDRDHLVKNDKANREILKTAALLLVEVAVDATKGKASYKPLKLLVERNAIIKELTDYNFREILIEQIKHSKILPTVNFDYISFEAEPVFYSSELAKVLCGDQFDDLLQYTDDSGIIELLNEIGTFTYDRDDFVERIDKWAKANEFSITNVKNHVVCMIGFVEEYGNQYSKMDVPRLIFDSEGKRIGKNISVFLKDEDANVSAPPTFANIRFMHPEMRRIIENRTGKKARQLADYFRHFGVKEYNTTQIIEKINASIKANLTKNNTDRAVKYAEECLQWVWKNRSVVAGISDKLHIYLKNRNGELTLSDELYFGKEYGGDVCEKLLEWNGGSCFVASIVDLIEADLESVHAFLEMLHVSEYPRKIMATVSDYTNEYKEYVVHNLPYPVALGGDYITGETDFYKNGSWIYMTLKSTIIKELTGILEHVSTDVILDWIYEDKELYQLLQSQRDMDGDTKLRWGRKDYRPVPQQYIYPYLAWQFSTIPWVSVGNNKYSLRNLILAPVGVVLAPELVEPDIEEYVRDKEHAKRLKERYESIFQDLHVCAGFEDMSDVQLYSVLLSLPERYGDEDIAKRIYSTLVRSERDIESAEGKKKRSEFIKNGKVLCKDKHGYQPIKDTYYLDEKEVCQKVTSQFNLIDIPGHQSVSQIKNLFGVEKLKLDGHLIGQPIFHSMNSYFQNEFERFKVLAFCYRMDTATKDETKRFGNMKVFLCTSVEAEYNGIHVDLLDYEYISTNNKTYYLKIPVTVDTPAKLHNYNMAAALAGILGSFFGSTKQFQQYRELYLAATDSVRRELILQVYEDISIFERSAKAINSYVDTKDEFISVVCKVANCNSSDIEKYIGDMDFDNLLIASNVPVLIQMFRDLNIDIEDYNAEALSSISLVPYYEDSISRLKRKYEIYYKQTVYNKYLDSTISEKKKIVRLFMDYDDRRLNIIDSINFACEEEFVKQMDIDRDVEITDLDVMCHENLESLKKRISTEKYLGEFVADTGNLSLLYYGEIDELVEAYQMIVDVNKEPEEEPASRFIPEVIPELYSISTSPKKTEEKERKTRNKTPGYSKKKGEHENVQIGRDGERYVYEYLRRKYQVVDWMSENGKAEGVNPTGSAGNGYDIRYVDEEGKAKYVEVKSSSNQEIVFYMSSFEHDFAISHINDYELYFVRNLSSKKKKPEILIVQDLFVDGEFNENKFTIEIDRTYTVSAEIQQMKGKDAVK